jgi:ribonuclease HI
VLATQPKKGYKRIFNNNKQRTDDVPTNLSHIRNPHTKEVTGDPEVVLDAVTSFFRKQQAPPAGVKHGRYGDDDSLRQYPFEHEDAVDGYKLEPRPGMDRMVLATDMTNDILHGDLFATVLGRAGKHKAPGPDGIPYELIKYGGELLLKALDNFMVGIWFTTEHPWPNSNTTLLYKKHDPLEVSNYRPIGLTNTMYKLWTAMLTEVLSSQAERYQVLSTCQEGFRPYRNTIRQLSMVINALEDARLYQQDIMMLFIDFTSAFNTIDHDKLLQIMYDLGFPEIAIDNVKGIYRCATTSVLTPYGPTDPIPVNRGTIQGDTLSPFLFLTFMEPLLRWLHSGGRGYKFGCLTDPTTRLLHQCASPTFADDLLCLTHDSNNMQVQADKVTKFGDWSNVFANGKKCGATGIRYGTEGKLQQCNPISDKAVAAVRRALQRVTVQGQAIPFHHPDKDPYDYLGVPLTPTLNYRWYFERTIDKLREKTNQLGRSFASGPQRLRTLQQCLIPGVAYAFPIMPLGMQEITRLDSVISKLAKQAYRLPLSLPNRMVHLSKNDGGLGIESLRVKYYQLNLATLVKSLNDTGTLGVVTKALLDSQLRILQGLRPADVPREATHLRLVKQLAMATETNLQLTKDGDPLEASMSNMVKCMKTIVYDPKALGLREVIPAKVYRELMQLGINTLADLTCERGSHMITASDLRRMYGRQVKHQHMRSLNTLTLLLNAHAPDGLVMPASSTVADLPREQRKINHGYLATELTASGTLPNTSLASSVLLMKHHFRPADNPAATNNDGQPDPTNHHGSYRTEATTRNTRHTRRRASTPDPNFGVPEFIQRLRDEVPREPLKGESNQLGDVLYQLRKDRQFTKHCAEEQLRRRRKQTANAHLATTILNLNGMTYTIVPRSCHHDHKDTNDCSATSGQAKSAQSHAARNCSTAPENNEVLTQLPMANNIGNPSNDDFFMSRLERSLFTYDKLPVDALHTIYGEHAVPAAFLAERVSNRQRQVLVRWEPTIVMKKHLGTWARAGYTIRATKSVSLIYGSGAAKHMVEADWNDTWEPIATMRACSAFTELYQQLEATRRAQGELGHNTRAGLKRRRRLDANLGEHAKTGYGREPPPAQPTPPALRRMIHITKEAVNPDMDITPPSDAGRGYLLFREAKYTPSDNKLHDTCAPHLRQTSAPTTPERVAALDVCHSYCPQGKYLGSVPFTRAKWLHRRYRETNPRGDYQKFAREMAMLIQRYATGCTDNHSGATVSRNTVTAQSWGTIKRLLTSPLAASLYHWSGATMTDVWASPLDVVTTASYYMSADAVHDAVFGATHHPFSSPWTRMSICHPPPDHDSMDKCLRWAIGSAVRYFNTEVVTLLVMPVRLNTAYERWLPHPTVTEIATIPNRCLRQHYRQHAIVTGDMTPLNFDWDVRLVLVANTTGAKQYGDLDQLASAVLRHVEHTIGRTNLITGHKHSAQRRTAVSLEYKVPRQLRLLRMDCSHTWPPPCANSQTMNSPRGGDEATNQRSADAFEDVVPSYSNSYLKWRADDLIYTDGSCVDNEDVGHNIGAGVCRPRNEGDTAYIQPCGKGPTNTITRAELCALVHATSKTCSNMRDEVIATDSLCSLHMITRGLRQPHTLRTNKHRDLIRTIIRHLEARASSGLHTTLLKVKSHSGISGNDAADKIAREVATREVPDNMPLHHIAEGNEPFGDMYWLATKETELLVEHRKPREQSEQPTPEMRYINDLGSALSSAAYAEHGVSGTTAGVYSTLLTTELKGADTTSSMAFWDMENSGELTHPHVINVMRARWGGIYTAKTALRHGTRYYCANSTNAPGLCPLCGLPDSATHILSECIAHKALHIQRHDRTGRCILKHIRKGSKGGCFIVADVGNAQTLGELGVTDKTIPAWMLPQGFSPTRVDITLTEIDRAASNMIPRRTRNRPSTAATKGKQTGDQSTVRLVEVGYRKDYDPGRTKRVEKLLQHQATMKALTASGWQVDYQVWDIGYTGIIPKDHYQQARRLGVTNPKKLLRDIHKIAVEHALLIMQDRRHQESQQPHGQQQRYHTTRPHRYHTPVDRLHTKAPPR